MTQNSDLAVWAWKGAMWTQEAVFEWEARNQELQNAGRLGLSLSEVTALKKQMQELKGKF
jgi:hypothetical protein